MKNQEPTLFIFITDNCNLKCLGCMQSCDRITDPYYMDIKEFQNYLKILQQHEFTIHGEKISTINLTGGDPLTHPQWKNFCKMIHKYIPNMLIDISTNGLLLNKLTDDELIQLNREYRVTFQLSIYSDKNLIKMYRKIIQRLNNLDVHFTFGGNSHFFFSKQDKINQQENFYKGYQEQCKVLLDNQNYVILYKNKIYNCWKDINILQKDNHLNDDAYYLNCNTPTELFQNKEHQLCDICRKCFGSGGEEFILWQHHNKDVNKIFNSNLKELYINDYPLYYSLQHNCKKNLEVLDDELFQKFLSKEQKHYVNTRFLNGKGDIFIPFAKEIPFELKMFLNNIKNINEYNIYFISIKATPEVEGKAYSTFLPFNKGEKLNNYFLKANNLLNAYNVFLKNSYLSNKFVIDIEQNNFELLPLN